VIDYGIVDPRSALKFSKLQGPVSTMIDYSQVLELSQQALEVRLLYDNRLQRDSIMRDVNDRDDFNRHAERIIHDHVRA